MTTSGKGADRKIEVTDSGERIVRNAPDHEDLVRKAALRPSLHAELWKDFAPDGELAHDDVIKQYLVWDREEAKFNEVSVGPFISRFRQVVEYAKLNKKLT